MLAANFSLLYGPPSMNFPYRISEVMDRKSGLPFAPRNVSVSKTFSHGLSSFVNLLL